MKGYAIGFLDFLGVRMMMIVSEDGDLCASAAVVVPKRERERISVVRVMAFFPHESPLPRVYFRKLRVAIHEGMHQREIYPVRTW